MSSNWYDNCFGCIRQTEPDPNSEGRDTAAEATAALMGANQQEGAQTEQPMDEEAAEMAEAEMEDIQLDTEEQPNEETSLTASSRSFYSKVRQGHYSPGSKVPYPTTVERPTYSPGEMCPLSSNDGNTPASLVKTPEEGDRVTTAKDQNVGEAVGSNEPTSKGKSLADLYPWLYPSVVCDEETSSSATDVDSCMTVMHDKDELNLERKLQQLRLNDSPPKRHVARAENVSAETKIASDSQTNVSTPAVVMPKVEVTDEFITICHEGKKIELKLREDRGIEAVGFVKKSVPLVKHTGQKTSTIAGFMPIQSVPRKYFEEAQDRQKLIEERRRAREVKRQAEMESEYISSRVLEQSSSQGSPVSSRRSERRKSHLKVQQPDEETMYTVTAMPSQSAQHTSKDVGRHKLVAERRRAKAIRRQAEMESEFSSSRAIEPSPSQVSPLSKKKSEKKFREEGRIETTGSVKKSHSQVKQLDEEISYPVSATPSQSVPHHFTLEDVEKLKLLVERKREKEIRRRGEMESEHSSSRAAEPSPSQVSPLSKKKSEKKIREEGRIETSGSVKKSHSQVKQLDEEISYPVTATPSQSVSHHFTLEDVKKLELIAERRREKEIRRRGEMESEYSSSRAAEPSPSQVSPVSKKKSEKKLREGRRIEESSAVKKFHSKVQQLDKEISYPVSATPSQSVPHHFTLEDVEKLELIAERRREKEIRRRGEMQSEYSSSRAIEPSPSQVSPLSKKKSERKLREGRRIEATGAVKKSHSQVQQLHEETSCPVTAMPSQSVTHHYTLEDEEKHYLTEGRRKLRTRESRRRGEMESDYCSSTVIEPLSSQTSPLSKKRSERKIRDDRRKEAVDFEKKSHLLVHQPGEEIGCTASARISQSVPHLYIEDEEQQMLIEDRRRLISREIRRRAGMESDTSSSTVLETLPSLASPLSRKRSEKKLREDRIIDFLKKSHLELPQPGEEVSYSTSVMTREPLGREMESDYSSPTFLELLPSQSSPLSKKRSEKKVRKDRRIEDVVQQPGEETSYTVSAIPIPSLPCSYTFKDEERQRLIEARLLRAREIRRRAEMESDNSSSTALESSSSQNSPLPTARTEAVHYVTKSYLQVQQPGEETNYTLSTTAIQSVHRSYTVEDEEREKLSEERRKLRAKEFRRSGIIESDYKSSKVSEPSSSQASPLSKRRSKVVAQSTTLKEAKVEERSSRDTPVADYLKSEILRLSNQPTASSPSATQSFSPQKKRGSIPTGSTESKRQDEMEFDNLGSGVFESSSSQGWPAPKKRSKFLTLSTTFVDKEIEERDKKETSPLADYLKSEIDRLLNLPTASTATPIENKTEQEKGSDILVSTPETEKQEEMECDNSSCAAIEASLSVASPISKIGSSTRTVCTKFVDAREVIIHELLNERVILDMTITVNKGTDIINSLFPVMTQETRSSILNIREFILLRDTEAPILLPLITRDTPRVHFSFGNQRYVAFLIQRPEQTDYPNVIIVRKI